MLQYYLRKVDIQEDSFLEQMIILDQISSSSYAIEDTFVNRIREGIEQDLANANFMVEKLSIYL